MSWDEEFDDPIPLPNGRVIRTLREAGAYVTKLPAKEAKHERWQTAMDVLLQAAEKRGPLMHARIGMLRALRKDMPPAAPSERKDRPWGRRPLKRDR